MRQKSGTHLLTLSAVGISALLLLSACSSDSGNDGSDQPAEDSTAVSDSVATAEVTEAAPTAEPDPAIPEADAEPAVKPVIEEAAEQAEPEMLAADAGATLYESNCKVCHDAGLLNAPKYSDKMAWSTRLTKDRETLYMHSAKGFNKMPAQAVNGVTDAQVKAAVDYMLASVS
ncbi:MAG: c-type cytochrome [Psychrobacter alimentarius]